MSEVNRWEETSPGDWNPTEAAYNEALNKLEENICLLQSNMRSIGAELAKVSYRYDEVLDEAIKCGYEKGR